MLVACAILHGATYANDAEIISLIGKGDARGSADADWQPAAVKQKLAGGSFVRTREQSQMALLLKDSTQVRLNQQSILNIKAVGSARQATQLELPRGRAWSQAKARGSDVAVGKRPILEVSTPAATAAIRGTDWELVVEPDGTSTITVLSGVVDFYNDHGRVTVVPNEQARAVPGKAPVKIFLSTAAERVQWVTAYRPQPRRWVPRPAGAIAAIVKDIEAAEYAAALNALEKDASLPRLEAALLLADMRLFLGEPGQAIGLLEPHAGRDGGGEPVAAALLGRALLIAGRIPDAARVLRNAAKTHASHVEVLLAQAELFRVQGDAAAARHAAQRVTAIDAKNAEAWYVIGRIETEREYTKAARAALNRAIRLRPDGAGYMGELGTLETFANELAAADAAFKGALEQTPDDYVALTGLGVLQLKRGETEAALESFLKAGVIEPRYARSWLFSGVAYYRLGEYARAQEAFEKAAKLDDKDPLPYFMKGLAHYDALELGKSIEAAREAQARIPFLKSLNQVLTDQKGSANLGSALAAFGMEEWSRAYAYDSYSPYWAGSHLFLADRFSGTFNKNSELFKGFLSDPTVFGASNRFSSMVPVPGHYASVEASVKRDLIVEKGLSAEANGYSVAHVPFAYSLAADRTRGDSAINSVEARGRIDLRGENYVVGLGAKPTHELGVFAFAKNSTYHARLADRQGQVGDATISLHHRRHDVGFNYKFNPTNHAWLKLGEGSEKQPMFGAIEIAEGLNQSLGTTIFAPGGKLNSFMYDQSQRDVQWRHTLDITPSWQLSWGLEHSREGKPAFSDVQTPVVTPQNPQFRSFQIVQAQDNHLDSKLAYVSSRLLLTRALHAQIDLHYQDVTLRSVTMTDTYAHLTSGVTALSAFRGADENHDRELNPRVGLKWNPAPGHTLRLAAQIWRKPPGVNTLAPVDTVGIPVDDFIGLAGGRLKRARLQHEMQFGPATFAQWFADIKMVKNPVGLGAGTVADLRLLDLERLQSRQRVYAIQHDHLEDRPQFGEGRIGQFGVAVNHLMTRSVTVAARYIHTESQNTPSDAATIAFNGLEIPFHPRHYLNLALNWQPYGRVVVGPTVTYRSRRYSDEANTELLEAGWAFGLAAYWESADKRLSVGAALDQIHSDKKSSQYRHAIGRLQAAYRF
jgi:Flp pilus assembly protein TadD